MSIKELSEIIMLHKGGMNIQYRYDDESIVMQHTRHVLSPHIHITDNNILKCCAKANDYDEFVEFCRPLAIADTEAWVREQRRPPPKGRTRRRFR